MDNGAIKQESRFMPEQDIPTWRVGEWWEYDTYFNNSWPDTGEFLELTGLTKYTVKGIEFYTAEDGRSYMAYNCSVSGTAAGHAYYNGLQLLVNGDRISEELSIPGIISGYRVLRASDFALLRERTYLEGFVHYDSMGLKFNLTESLIDQDLVDICDFPLVPGENYNFSTYQNRTFSLYLSETGYYLRRYSELFPYSYEMRTSAKKPIISPAGVFDIYKLSATSLTPDDPSSLNYSYSPDAKHYVAYDVYRLMVTDQNNISVVDNTMELVDYEIEDVQDTINSNTDFALPGIPITVNGTFPDHKLEFVIVSFPFSGQYVETTCDLNGYYMGEITTPMVFDNTPFDGDISSFGLGAWIKNDITSFVTKTIVIVEADDEAPIAHAGADKVIDEGTFVYFNGTQSRDNMGVKYYNWSFAQNGSDILLFGEKPVFNFTLPGSYDITLTVTDYGGNIDTDNMVLLVNDITPPIPVIAAGRDIDQGTLFIFDGSSCYDPELGSIINYSWTFYYNGLNTLLWGEFASFKFDIPGDYSVTLNITDNGSNYALSTFLVRVKDTSAPMALAGIDQTVPQGHEVLFNGSKSTDNVVVNNWTWSFQYDNTAQYIYGMETTFTFWTVGNYQVTLTVLDASDNDDTDIMWINVTDSTPPVAEAGDDETVNQGSRITFDGRSSFDNVAIINYTWTFNDGENRTIYGQRAFYVFNNPGTYVVTLTVMDEAGNTGGVSSDSMLVIVGDSTPPRAVAGEGIEANVNENVYFNGTGSWDNVGVTNWTWTFIHQNRATVIYGVESAFSFSEIGTYEVELRVRDDAGLIDIDTLFVVIREGLKVEVIEGEITKTTLEDDQGKTVVQIEVAGNGTLDFKKMTREEAKEKVNAVGFENGVQDLGIFLDITIDELDWILIEIPYDESDLPEGMEEESLKLYFWDEQSGIWKEVENSQVNTEANIVWANVTHLTIFAPLSIKDEAQEEDKDEYSPLVGVIILIVLFLLFLLIISRKRKSETQPGGEDEKVEFTEIPEGPITEEEESVLEMDEAEIETEDICPECGEDLKEDDDICPYCGASFESEENEIIESLKRLRPGDIIISRSGTERTVLSVDEDQIEVRVKMPDGREIYSTIDRNLLILRFDALVEVITGEKFDFKIEEKINICQECGEEVEEATDICPGCGVQLWEEKAEAAERSSYLERAEADVDIPDENTKRKIETLLLEAVLASTNNDYIASLKACDAALELWSENPNAWYLKGVAYTAMGLSEMAEKCIDESIHICKDIATFTEQVIVPTTSLIHERRNINEIKKYLEKGSIQASREEYDLALKSYDTVIKIDPVNADAWYLKAVVYTAMGVTDMAKRCLGESAMIRRSSGKSSPEFIKKIKESSPVLEKKIEEIPTFEIIEEVQFQCSDCETLIDESDSRCPNCGVKFKTQTYEEGTDETKYDIGDHGYFDFEGRLF